jgi:hypothetical protein
MWAQADPRTADVVKGVRIVIVLPVAARAIAQLIPVIHPDRGIANFGERGGNTVNGTTFVNEGMHHCAHGRVIIVASK